MTSSANWQRSGSRPAGISGTFLGIWLGVSLIVIAVWLLTDPGGYFWPIWPIGGMGIAAFFIGLDAFGPNRGVITEAAIDDEVSRITRGSREPRE